MKRLIAFLLLFSAAAFAQTYSDVALQNSSSNYARVVPFAVVTVCASTDTATPCTNRVTTYTDQTLTTPCTLISTISFGNSGGNGGPTSGTNCNNPGLADANGNFTVFAPVGLYRICILSQNYLCLLKTIASFAAGSSTITGSGTANTYAMWTGTSTLGNAHATETTVVSSPQLNFAGAHIVLTSAANGGDTMVACSLCSQLVLSPTTNSTESDPVDSYVRILKNGGSGGGVTLAAGQGSGIALARLQSNNTVGWWNIPASNFSTLPATASNGSMLYCQDCHVATNPCSTSGGTGSGDFAYKINGAWVCP